MPRFEVHWEFECEDADTPLQAAEHAFVAMRAAGTIATHFRVQAENGEIDYIDLYTSYGDAGRPEDLGDVAPELVEALHGVIRYRNPGPQEYDRARAAMARARKAVENVAS